MKTLARALVLVTVVVFAALAPLAGCGQGPAPADGGAGGDGGRADAGRDGGADAGAADAGLPLAQACTVLNARRCEYLRGCGLIAASVDATRDCLAWLTATWCGAPLWPARVAVGTLRYDGFEAQACAEGFAGRACAEYQSLPGACARIHAPNAYTRQDCYDGYSECTEGVCRGAACPRSCQPRGAAGEVCRLDGDCRTGLFCRISNTAAGVGSCTAFGTSGSACDPQLPCATYLACIGGSCQFPPAAGSACPGLVCDASAWCRATPDGGVCAAKSAEGGACSDDVQCFAGQLCDPIRATCQPRDLLQSGSPCSSRQRCPAGTVCLGASASALGSCVRPLVEGDGCAQSSECAPHLSCIPAGDGGRLCGGRAQAGTACSYDRDCLVLSRCRLGTCVDLPATGESCAASQECLWGPCSLQADAGAICVERLGPGALCQVDVDCASQKCIAGRCLAACAP